MPLIKQYPNGSSPFLGQLSHVSLQVSPKIVLFTHSRHFPILLHNLQSLLISEQEVLHSFPKRVSLIQFEVVSLHVPLLKHCLPGQNSQILSHLGPQLNKVLQLSHVPFLKHVSQFVLFKSQEILQCGP